MFKKSISLHFLLLAQGILLITYGNFILQSESWARMSSIQYGVFLFTAISWLGTDLSGIKIISQAKGYFVKASLALQILIFRLLVFLLISPQSLFFYNAEEIFILFCLVVPSILTPTFFYYGYQKRFSYYFRSELLLRSANATVLIIAILQDLGFLFVLAAFSVTQSLFSIKLVLAFMSKPLALHALKNFSWNSFLYSDGKTFFLMQCSQQVLYGLPTVVLTNAGNFDQAVLFTNVERLVRIVRGVFGNVVKVLLGSDRYGWSKIKQIWSSWIICGTSLIIVTLIFLHLVKPGINFVDIGVQFLFVALFILTIPITIITSTTIGLKHKKNQFPIFMDHILIISIILCLGIMLSNPTSLGFVYAIVFVEITVCAYLLLGRSR